MEWPSKNVAKGGFFNNAKRTVSPEAKNFVKILINEQKMAQNLRSNSYHLRNDKVLANQSGPPKNQRVNQILEVPYESRRRSLATIRESGAYDRVLYRPMPLPTDREKAKDDFIRKLLNEEKEKERPKKKEQVPEMSRYDELKREINERKVWLEEMEELGEGARYREIIRSQILKCVNEMEALNAQH